MFYLDRRLGAGWLSWTTGLCSSESKTESTYPGWLQRREQHPGKLWTNWLHQDECVWWKEIQHMNLHGRAVCQRKPCAWWRSWESSGVSVQEAPGGPLATCQQGRPAKSLELLLFSKLEDQRGYSLMSLIDWHSDNSSHHNRHTHQQ